MTMQMVVVAAAMTLVAALAAATLGSTSAIVFAVVLVALMARALQALFHGREALRVRLTGEPAARRAPRRPSEAGPD
jgi:hypothetical protein